MLHLPSLSSLIPSQYEYLFILKVCFLESVLIKISMTYNCYLPLSRHYWTYHHGQVFTRPGIARSEIFFFNSQNNNQELDSQSDLLRHTGRNVIIPFSCFSYYLGKHYWHTHLFSMFVTASYILFTFNSFNAQIWDIISKAGFISKEHNEEMVICRKLALWPWWCFENIFRTQEGLTGVAQWLSIH